MNDHEKTAEVIVVGGGPAGMMAAGTAARRGRRVMLIDKNTRLGWKLSITGKGRCNLTNNADISDFFAQIPRNPSFLYSALYSFTNLDTMELFESLGVPLKVERGGRVFPVSDRAQDVVAALRRYIREVSVACGEVRAVLQKGGTACGVLLKDGRQIFAESVVLACGGASYPKTGSDGGGFRLAENLGHTITPLSPSLVPLCSPDDWVSSLAGLSLKNVQVSLIEAGKTVYSEFGEMLFTHFGVSGPVILTLSAHLKRVPAHLSIDLKPALSSEQLDARILRDFSKYANKNFANALSDLLPKALIPVVVARCEIPGNTKVNQITKQQRQTLCAVLKGLSVAITGKRPLAEAIVTSGGVCVKEIDPGSMASKKVKGLYFAGEMIDVDAYTGGYNLQIAFSTGHAAGMHA